MDGGMDARTALRELVEAGDFDAAREIAFKYIERCQNDEDFVILFILLKIRDAEIAAGESDIFSSPVGHSPRALIGHYTRIKFYLRRYEYDMPDFVLDEAFNYFLENKVSVNALYRIADFACVDKAKVYGRLAGAFRSAGMEDLARALDSI